MSCIYTSCVYRRCCWFYHFNAIYKDNKPLNELIQRTVHAMRGESFTANTQTQMRKKKFLISKSVRCVYTIWHVRTCMIWKFMVFPLALYPVSLIKLVSRVDKRDEGKSEIARGYLSHCPRKWLGGFVFGFIQPYIHELWTILVSNTQHYSNKF